MRAIGIFKTLMGMAGWEPKYVVKVKPSARVHRRHGWKLRGLGYTRASKEESKARRKMAARSRRINWR